MVNFVINTPSHKRWYLPDGVHLFNSVMYGDQIHWSIIHRLDHYIVHGLSGYISLSNPSWQDLYDTAVALAEKKFRKKSLVKEPRLVREY